MKEYSVLGHKVRLSDESQEPVALKAIELLEKEAQGMGMTDYNKSDQMLLLALKIAATAVEKQSEFSQLLTELNSSVSGAIAKIDHLESLSVQ